MRQIRRRRGGNHAFAAGTFLAQPRFDLRRRRSDVRGRSASLSGDTTRREERREMRRACPGLSSPKTSVGTARIRNSVPAPPPLSAFRRAVHSRQLNGRIRRFP